jgi:membrane protease YdiL (CAAX protease family)
MLNESESAQNIRVDKTVVNQDKVPIASHAHTLGLLAIFAGYFLIVFLLTRHAGMTASVPAAPRPNLLPGYLESIGFDLAILYYVWAGISRRRISLLELAGGRWASWAQVIRDFLIAIPFWIIWEAVAIGVSRLLSTGAPSATSTWIVPRGPIEVPLWIATSLIAGFCEELVFRG